MVYACEPVDRLREFMRNKIACEGISNVVVLDGTIEDIPFEDNTFDISMSAYVLGLDYKKEISNLERVTKNGGYIIDCRGEEDEKRKAPNKHLLDAGFQWSYYVSKNGGDVYRYWKKVIK
jgi:ubiquinone/menaquinone biosynthesis C-methylase UbiE